MKLQYQDYPTHVDSLIQSALLAVDPATAVQQYIQRHESQLTIGSQTYNLETGRIFLISVGKAAVPMGQAVAHILDDALVAGIFVTKADNIETPSNQTIVEDYPGYIILKGGHPISNGDSLQATTAVTELLSHTEADDLVIFLISGGTSALLTQPRVPLQDWQQLNQALLASGCTIKELNCVRKQLDTVKGGGLAQLAAPASYVTLILSDVVGNPVDLIGSGPTVTNATTAVDALGILTHYNLATQLETAVWQRIYNAITTATSGPVLPPAPTIIIGDVRQAATAVLAKATRLGFFAQILTTHMEGEAREVGRIVAAIAKDMPSKRCFIMGGETTVTLRGNGRGSRNLETALAAAIALDGCDHVVVISFATDGDDGLTGVAGAMVTGQTVADGRVANLDPVVALNQNDSYTFFQQLDRFHHSEALSNQPTTLIQTEPTGTNVNDLLLILTY